MSVRRKKTGGSRAGSATKGVYVIKGAAPRSGTKLTREKIYGHFRSLNSLNGRDSVKGR